MLEAGRTGDHTSSSLYREGQVLHGFLVVAQEDLERLPTGVPGQVVQCGISQKGESRSIFPYVVDMWE